MIDIEVSGPTGQRVTHRFASDQAVTLGRGAQCDLVLRSELVSRHHATLRRVGATLELEDRSVNGTLVDGAHTGNGRSRIEGPAELRIGPYQLRVQAVDGDDPGDDPAGGPTSLTGGEGDASATTQLAERRRIHRALMQHLDLARLDAQAAAPDVLRPRVEAALVRLCGPRDDGGALVRELLDEVLGLGPLQPLLADPSVSEIMVVDPKTIYVERAGRLERTALCFTDDDSVRAALERIVTPLGRRIDESVPHVDARLPDGSRVHAVIPPLALRGPCITIRKFRQERLTYADLIAGGSMTEEMAHFLDGCVRARKNIVIAGGTGSGKTTLLNLLSGSIPEAERVVTIEDAAELQLAQEHVVALETRPPNLEGRGEFTIRDLVRTSLRMRPDRIVVGECRGAEALDMLQAMNTGHDGSMTTTHASSPREALGRLEMLCLLSGVDLPIAALRYQIASSVHVLVQQARLADGSRRVTSIAEVLDVDEDGRIALEEVYTFDRGGPCAGADGPAPAGRFRATGHLPTFAHELRALGRATLPGGQR